MFKVISAATVGMLLFSMATTSVAFGTKMSVPLVVPSDPKTRYTLLEFEQVTDRVILATTMREGTSSTSYSTRVIDCARMRFKYLAEGDTLTELEQNVARNRGQILSGNLDSLIEGSISDYVARQACAASVSPS